MSNRFDELAKGLALSVTRRQALKKFGVSLGSLALVCFGLANGTAAGTKSCLPTGLQCSNDNQCCSGVCSKYKVNNGGKGGPGGGGGPTVGFCA
jgi:hypothetical protein